MPFNLGGFLQNTVERTTANVATHTILDRLGRFQNRLAERTMERDDDESTPRQGKRGKPVYPLISRPTPLLDVFDRVRKR